MVLVFSKEDETRYAGSATFGADDRPETVLEFYREQLELAEFESELSPFGPTLELGGMITAFSRDQTRGLTLTVTRLDEGCEAVVNFTQSKS